MIKLLLIAASIFGAKTLFDAGTTVKAANSLKFNPTGIKWKGFKNGSFNFDLIFTIINTSNKIITISFLFCDIYFTTGTKLTSINKQNWNLKIQEEAQTTVKIPVKLFLTDILFIGIDLIKRFKNGKLPKALQLKGYIRVNDFTISFDEIVNIA